MSTRKQDLMKQHRRSKRVTLLGLLVAALAACYWLGPWFFAVILLVGWVANEAWFSDHLFYHPGDDYHYQFGAVSRQSVTLDDGLVRLSAELMPGDTLILEVTLRANWLGRLLDPYVRIGTDRQDFERGVGGIRYLNLSGQSQALALGQLAVTGHRCRLPGTATLFSMSNPDFAQQRVMVLAPHADDAELAAFGLYSRCAEASIVTLTQGEIEAERYRSMGLDDAGAARLKGRLRSWDSLAIPLWGGVPASRCVQLGYYCMRLREMSESVSESFGSRESQEQDVRRVRQHNATELPADADGLPTWNNLVSDLVRLLELFQPQVVVMPHPELDPHEDHVATYRAIHEAMAVSTWKPSVSLLYANHLHDNDRWPMGPAGFGVALPPALSPMPHDGLWSPSLSTAVQLDKAMSLAMQHDLQDPLLLKKRVRRFIQRWLAGRTWPATGENEFFRKAVRRHELFWVRHL